MFAILYKNNCIDDYFISSIVKDRYKEINRLTTNPSDLAVPRLWKNRGVAEKNMNDVAESDHGGRISMEVVEVQLCPEKNVWERVK